MEGRLNARRYGKGSHRGQEGTKLDQGQGSKKTKLVTSPHSIPYFLFEPHNF